MNRAELVAMLERFVGDAPSCDEREWDAFTSVKASTELEPFRQRLLEQGDGWMDVDAIRAVIVELKRNED